ncbi:MAG: hypothetical protein IJY42_01805 [Clostridia bacterium]|nr:hypothetical protein [Clostridia bacterium]
MKIQAFHGEVWINAHPEIAEAVYRVNSEPLDGGYGKDRYSRLATERMQREFREPIDTTFAINGTAANVMALKAMMDRWSAILCAEQTHIHTYEAGAFEFNLGNKILTAKIPDGKLTPQIIRDLLLATKKYKYRPKVIAMAQPTEYGTVYTPEEIETLLAML